MQVIVVCVACNTRFTSDISALEKGMVCPKCGGALKSAPRINTKKPSKSHLEKYEPLWKDAPPPSSGKLPRAGDDPLRKVILYGSFAVGATLLLGIAWIAFDRFDGDALFGFGQGAAPAVRPADAGPAGENVVAPEFAPLAPVVPPKPKREKKSAAEVVEAEGGGVVRVTPFDARGEPYGSASGFVVERRRVDEWIEPEVGRRQEPPQGELWLVATNYRVVAGASAVAVRLRDGTTRTARGIAALDRERDLALLALDDAPPQLTVLEPAEPSSWRQGDEVLAIGHSPTGDVAVSSGIVDAIRGTKELPVDVAEQVRAPEDQRWLSTTAAGTDGGRGGPLLTMMGEVVGIDTWGYDADGGLAFAVPISHVTDLRKRAIEFDVDRRSRVRLQAPAGLKPVDVPETLAGRSDWREEEVREELSRAAARAVAIDRRPATDEDYIALRSAATMLTVAAARRFDVVETKQLLGSLAKRSWDFETDVNPINRFALESLDEGQSGVFCFGKVRRISAATRRRLWIDLTGRGRGVVVNVPGNQPAPELKVGDDVALFGCRIAVAPTNSRSPRGVPEILAGLVWPAAISPVPDDTALQAAYDLVRLQPEEQGFAPFARKLAASYERVTPLVGKSPVRWQRVTLNTRGRRFDAVRFSVPPELMSDMVWSFNSPDGAIEQWGVIPVGDVPLRVSARTFTYRDVPVPGLLKEETGQVILQGADGGSFAPGDDYLLWFTFKDAQPRRTAITVRAVPSGSFNARDEFSLGHAMKDGTAFKPEEMTRMFKALKDKAAVPK
jgi:S1-C subfamily serine protease/DNA-directed RNA polymerase subunit RPC12/RpoP